MRVGAISTFTNYHCHDRHHCGVPQPQVGPLAAAYLPPRVPASVTCPTIVRVSPPAPEPAPTAP
jgi:hypothetical protein